MLQLGFFRPEMETQALACLDMMDFDGKQQILQKIRSGADAAAWQRMALTLADAGIAPEQVDHINAHGTGTHMNDSCETAAIHAVFGDHAKDIAVVSTKSMTGHLLGGAAAVEAIACVMAIREGIVPPTIGYKEPDPECDLDITPNKAVEMPINVAISNSLGFGGHNACIVFKKV